MTTSADALASLAAVVLRLRDAADENADEPLQLEAIAAVHNSLATSLALEAALPHVLAALEPLSRTISDEPKGSALTPAVATAAARALADTRTHVPAARLFWLLDECGVVDGAPSPHAPCAGGAERVPAVRPRVSRRAPKRHRLCRHRLALLCRAGRAPLAPSLAPSLPSRLAEKRR